MPSTELAVLMQAVLDGEASAAEQAELQQRLAADPESRAEFERLRGLFEQLGALPQPHPPEGLVAAVSAALPQAHQLSASSRVLGTKPVDAGRVPSSTPPFWRSVMTQASIFANRKTWIGIGVAAAALFVVVRLGVDGNPKKDDLGGTVVPAERYRAAAASAADITLGDQSVAKLLQNDSFLRLIKDPQVRAMALDPGFQAAAKAMMANPAAAKEVLAHPEAARFMAGNPAAAQAALNNAEAARAVAASAEAARALMANAEAARFMAAHPQAARFMAASADAARFMDAHADAAKAVLQNAEVARFMAANPDAARFMDAHAAAARLAAGYTEAARFMAANPDMARFMAANPEAARSLLLSPDAARLVAQNLDVARFMANNEAAARLLMGNPEASRALMQSPQAQISALYQRVDASN